MKNNKYENENVKKKFFGQKYAFLLVLVFRESVFDQKTPVHLVSESMGVPWASHITLLIGRTILKDLRIELDLHHKSYLVWIYWRIPLYNVYDKCCGLRVTLCVIIQKGPWTSKKLFSHLTSATGLFLLYCLFFLLS